MHTYFLRIRNDPAGEIDTKPLANVVDGGSSDGSHCEDGEGG
ncbi:hypothetical protein [Agrobacterium vitis]|nr:hypothetical protein [Agrobacterium vitis]